MIFGLNGKLYSMANLAYFCESGAGDENMDVYDFATNKWSKPSGPTTLGAGAERKGGVAYHPGRRVAYWYDYADNLFTWSPSTGTWSSIGASGQSAAYDYTCAVDHINDTMLILGGNGNPTPIFIPNLSRGTGVLRGSGAPPSRTGVAFASDIEKYICPRGSSQIVDLFDSAAGQWSTATFSGETPDALEGNGTYGRWQYISALQGCVLVNSVDSNVYFFRTS
jgi:hypothetical protein